MLRKNQTRKEIRNRSFESVEDLVLEAKNLPAHFYNCDFDKLDLSRALLDNCIFDGCSLKHVKLGKAVKAEFYSSDLSHIDMTEADIRWVFAQNVKVDGIKLMGAQMTMDCWFMNGVIVTEGDAWRLIYWAMLPDSPDKKAIIELIPKRFKLLIDSQYNLGSR